ncbi:hypothetical protein BT96DRAFT_1018929 [Gymnopus androsaceus JB14]|uniref:SMODS and SLOG-associating 2TM effector domain-containing protein n=1 Tax=Gymnopus androsaceus JB14 TaxID=1447944 RepID=A0A6A4HRK4_9AGAR|nr:hypothetical protein BT96DRAFT_1018929 [Gymnopus androsaceus JB14]
MDLPENGAASSSMPDPQSSRPDEPNTLRHSPSNSSSGFVNSPTNIDDLSRGFASRPNTLPPPLPVFRRSDERPREGFNRLPSTLPERNSTLDHVVPTTSEKYREKTIRERLEPTLKRAIEERDKYNHKAKMTGVILNIAIGLQVLLGALTTAVSAATTGRQTSIVVSVFGGASTLVASYLAKTRGSTRGLQEPDFSIARAALLDQFIRECDAFGMDFGHLDTSGHDEKLNEKLNAFRDRFEEIMGNDSGIAMRLRESNQSPSYIL